MNLIWTTMYFLSSLSLPSSPKTKVLLVPPDAVDGKWHPKEAFHAKIKADIAAQIEAERALERARRRQIRERRLRYILFHPDMFCLSCGFFFLLLLCVVVELNVLPSHSLSICPPFLSFFKHLVAMGIEIQILDSTCNEGVHFCTEFMFPFAFAPLLTIFFAMAAADLDDDRGSMRVETMIPMLVLVGFVSSSHVP